VVYRLGLGGSRNQARQLVRHGRPLSGRKTNIPSALVRAGDVVAVRDGSRELEIIKNAVETTGQRQIPAWLNFDLPGMSAQINSLPTRGDIVPRSTSS
jgi:small subunit ribosomal protein S4